MLRPAPGRRNDGSNRQQTTSESSATGTLTKKIQCQLNVSVISPPRNGPSTDDRPKTAPNARVKVGDDRQRDREDGATAEALEASEQDELPHLLTETCKDRRDEEESHRPDEDGAPAEEVRQLAVDRTADRRGQEVDGDRPRVQLVALEIGHDLRQRDADDRLVE